MKLCAHFAAKRQGTQPYSSDAWSLTIEAEPPAEAQQSRESLKAWVERLFDEVKARVEDQIQQDQPDSREQPSRRSSPHRPFVTGNDRETGRRTRGNGRSGNGQHGNGRQNGDLCSPKQANFIKSLGTQAGFTYDDLGYMAQEAFGKRDLSTLTKKEASAMIKNLLEGDRETR